jgi:hypothetical protein
VNKANLTGLYYSSKMASLRRMLQRTRIELSDYLQLPGWVKEDLLIGWGCVDSNPQKNRESKNAQDRLWEQGLKLSAYRPGYPESIFPKGLVKNIQRRGKRNVKKVVSSL